MASPRPQPRRPSPGPGGAVPAPRPLLGPHARARERGVGGAAGVTRLRSQRALSSRGASPLRTDLRPLPSRGAALRHGIKVGARRAEPRAAPAPRFIASARKPAPPRPSPLPRPGPPRRRRVPGGGRGGLPVATATLRARALAARTLPAGRAWHPGAPSSPRCPPAHPRARRQGGGGLQGLPGPAVRPVEPRRTGWCWNLWPPRWTRAGVRDAEDKAAKIG